MHRQVSRFYLRVGLATHRYSIAVMALSPEGTEPDIDMLPKTLSDQVHAQTQVSMFHLHVDWAAHRICMALMALSPEGTEPDTDVLKNPLLVQAAEPCTDTGQQVALQRYDNVVGWWAKKSDLLKSLKSLTDSESEKKMKSSGKLG